jgi:hypothetical protein
LQLATIGSRSAKSLLPAGSDTCFGLLEVVMPLPFHGRTVWWQHGSETINNREVWPSYRVIGEDTEAKGAAYRAAQLAKAARKEASDKPADPAQQPSPDAAGPSAAATSPDPGEQAAAEVPPELAAAEAAAAKEAAAKEAAAKWYGAKYRNILW